VGWQHKGGHHRREPHFFPNKPKAGKGVRGDGTEYDIGDGTEHADDEAVPEEGVETYNTDTFPPYAVVFPSESGRNQTRIAEDGVARFE
jgi:hypothetical protein